MTLLLRVALELRLCETPEPTALVSDPELTLLEGRLALLLLRVLLELETELELRVARLLLLAEELLLRVAELLLRLDEALLELRCLSCWTLAALLRVAAALELLLLRLTEADELLLRVLELLLELRVLEPLLPRLWAPISGAVSIAIASTREVAK